MESRPGAAENLADLPDGGALVLGQRLQLRDLAESRVPRCAEQATSSSSSRQAFMDTLPDEISLELGHGTGTWGISASVVPVGGQIRSPFVPGGRRSLLGGQP